MKCLIGYKLGMTRLFNEDGSSVPVTMIKIFPNYVVQIKDLSKDGYRAVQITTGNKKIGNLNRPKMGHLKKSGVDSGGNLWEIRINDNEVVTPVGGTMTIRIFEGIKKVDVTGISKGKGFAGTVKRWNFHTQDASHGNSLSHRAPGSIGQNQTPGKVFKGKKMAGHLGHCRVTVQNLCIMNIDMDKELLLIKGSTPGVIGSNIIIKESVKCCE